MLLCGTLQTENEFLHPLPCAVPFDMLLLSLLLSLFVSCNYCTWQTVTTHRQQRNSVPGRGMSNRKVIKWLVGVMHAMPHQCKVVLFGKTNFFAFYFEVSSTLGHGTMDIVWPGVGFPNIYLVNKWLILLVLLAKHTKTTTAKAATRPMLTLHCVVAA